MGGEETSMISWVCSWHYRQESIKKKKEEDGLRDTSPQGKPFFHMKQHEDRQYQVQAYRVLLRCLCSLLLFLGEVIHSILYQQVIPLKEFLDVGDMHPFTIIIGEHISHIVT